MASLISILLPTYLTAPTPVSLNMLNRKLDNAFIESRLRDVKLK